MIQINAAPELLLAFVMLLARIGGLTAFAPFWASFAVSPRIRVVLALVLTMGLFPLLQDKLPAVPLDPVVYLIGIGGELLIGALFGLVGQLLLGAMQLAGTLMGFQMGFSLVNVIDPQTQVEISVLAVLYNLAGLLVFVLLDGHYWYLKVLSESYQVLPAFGAGLSDGVFELLGQLAANMFLLGVQLAAPIVLVGICVDLLLGVVGRAAPQIHILIAGMPLKVMVGFAMLSLSAGALLPLLRSSMERFQGDLWLILRLLGG